MFGSDDWLLYGAYGYTGALIAREAVRCGLHPVLAGRDGARVRDLADELGLAHRAFALDRPDLAGIKLVLNCAGPFSATAAPMIAAAMSAGAHYLDITGEIEVFEHAFGLDAQARRAGIVLCPGVGFDVIPTDCIARALHEALPDATRLALGFQSNSRLSAGTARTTIEGLGRGTTVRRGGRLVRERLGRTTRTVDFGRGPRVAMAFPWGDVSTAYRTTGIPDIEVLVAAPRAVLRAAPALNLLAPVLRLRALQALLKARAGLIQGPDQEARARARIHLWGEVRNAAGATRTARLTCADGYDVTLHGALAVIERIRTTDAPPAGATTPSLLCGADLITRLPGSGPLEIG